MKNIIFCLALILIVAGKAGSQTKPWIDFNQNGQMDLYENPEAAIDNRVNDLLSRMTVYEKMQLLHEVAPAIPRLGIRKYDHGNEALHGVVRPGKFTVFPQAIGLAATWNPELIFDVATVSPMRPVPAGMNWGRGNCSRPNTAICSRSGRDAAG
ncbi:MAG: hypothetical protein PHI28_08420 [Mangrovibacterium sp.]|nr:hypothetical protein [Mangrovibacterium sp.]